MNDIPSKIDLREMADARAWEAGAGQRPGREQILGRIVNEAARQAGALPRMLELGSGPGFLAQRMLEHIPDVRYTALDFSPAMHDLARARLGEAADRVTFLLRDFKSAHWTEGLTAFDMVVTNQAVHELRHKRHVPAFHRQALEVLMPGGIYLMCDHVAGPGAMPDSELYMTLDEQAQALRDGGFADMRLPLRTGSLALHRAYGP